VGVLFIKLTAGTNPGAIVATLSPALVSVRCGMCGRVKQTPPPPHADTPQPPPAFPGPPPPPCSLLVTMLGIVS
jgi:hypothetical protein